MKETSRIASEHRAIAAINGSYFDMKRGNSVCFLKVGNQVVDTTTLSECKLRVTGAMHVHKGKIKLIPWSRQIEKEYKGETGIVLANAERRTDLRLEFMWHEFYPNQASS